MLLIQKSFLTLFKDKVLNKFDYKNLDTKEFENLKAIAENIEMVIYNILISKINVLSYTFSLCLIFL